MRLSIIFTVLGHFLAVTLASPVELAPYLGAETDASLLEERSASVCATCVGQCVAWLALCTAVCGPWSEIFTGPLPCTECLVVAGASQQCFQCTEKCEKSGSKRDLSAGVLHQGTFPAASEGDEIASHEIRKRAPPKNLMFSSCAGPEFKQHACHGINEPSVQEYGSPGICTMKGYAKDGSSGIGVNCPANQECDVAVGPTSNCAPVATQ